MIRLKTTATGPVIARKPKQLPTQQQKQAYAHDHRKEFDLSLHQIAEIWRTGSVVRSWLHGCAH